MLEAAAGALASVGIRDGTTPGTGLGIIHGTTDGMTHGTDPGTAITHTGIIRIGTTRIGIIPTGAMEVLRTDLHIHWQDNVPIPVAEYQGFAREPIARAAVIVLRLLHVPAHHSVLRQEI